MKLSTFYAIIVMFFCNTLLCTTIVHAKRAKSSKAPTGQMGSSQRKSSKAAGASSKNNNVRHQKAHAMLANLQGDSLTATEEKFFDKSFVAAYDKVSNNEDDDDNKRIVNAKIIKQRKVNKSGGKKKQNLRSLQYYPYYYGGFYDYTFFLTWHCRGCFDSIWRDRRLKKQHQKSAKRLDEAKFNRVLCKLLRQGPHKIFAKVTDCSVSFDTE